MENENSIQSEEVEPVILCPHCRKPVIPSEVSDYVWQCLDCDEDFMDFECYKVEKE